MADSQSPVFRIDSFVVPDQARTVFLERVRTTHEILRRQPGFVFDRIVERELGDGTSRMITIVEWSGGDAIAGAGRAVKQFHAAEHFSAADFIAANGIRPDIGIYQPVD